MFTKILLHSLVHYYKSINSLLYKIAGKFLYKSKILCIIIYLLDTPTHIKPPQTRDKVVKKKVSPGTMNLITDIFSMKSLPYLI